MSDTSQYLLNRDSKESARLTAQHDWLKKLVGCNIHPSIPTEKPNLRIADVATGTAIWLLDLAQILPVETQFVGFDISDKQFPAPEDRPGNVSLHEHSALDPFPEEYIGTFDVVAVRLITPGLRTGDWDATVKNTSALLKPGGYLQWIEPLHSSFQVANIKAGAPNKATRQAVDFFLEGYKKTLFPGPLQLPDLCETYDLEDIALELYPTDHYSDFEMVRTQGKEFLAGACTTLTPFIVGDGSSGVTAEYIQDIVKKSMEELDGDLYLRSKMQFIVRRKRQ